MKLQSTTLTDFLSATSGPALTWFAPYPWSESETSGSNPVRERVELGGPVARRWIAKTDNFLDSEFPFGATSFVAELSPHWRAPFWIATCWLRGMELRSPSFGPDCDFGVSTDIYFLESLQDQGGPDVLVVQSTDSFGFAWPGELPFGITDGTADVMSYGDEVENPYAADPSTVIVGEDADWTLPEWLTDPLRDGATEADGAVPRNGLRISDLLTVDLLGLKNVNASPDGDTEASGRPSILRAGERSDAGGNPPSPIEMGRLDGHRVLLTTASPVTFTAQLIQLWLRGATAVWVPGGGPDVERIAKQEAVTMRVGPAE